MSSDSKPRRRSFKAYSTEPKSDRGSFVQYIEESGANAMLIEAVSQLFEVSEKPENPIEWLRLYFRQFVPSRSEALAKAQQILKEDIIKQESRLTHFRMEERRLKERLEDLQYGNNGDTYLAPKQYHDEEYRRYKDYPEDYRWRIKPDPLHRMTESDTLIQTIENEGESKGQMVPATSTTASELLSKDEQNFIVAYTDDDNLDNYDDYPTLYFGVYEEPTIPEPPPLPLKIKDIVTDSGPKNETEKVAELKDINRIDEDKAEEAEALLNEFAGEFEEEAEPEVIVVFETEAEFEELDEDVEEFGILKTDPSAKRNLNAAPLPPPVTTTTIPKRSRKKSKKKSKTSGGKMSLKEREGQRRISEQTGGKTAKPKSIRSTTGSKLNIPNTPVTPEELPPLPFDPLTLELEQVTPLYWKEDFSLTKGHERMFNDETEEFGYEDLLPDEDEEDGSYLSSRGEKRKRKFRSQIIHEAFWKPDRGRSIQFDSRFDLADIPVLSSNPSTVRVQRGLESVGPHGDIYVAPSNVSGIASDNVRVIKPGEMRMNSEINIPPTDLEPPPCIIIE